MRAGKLNANRRNRKQRPYSHRPMSEGWHGGPGRSRYAQVLGWVRAGLKRLRLREAAEAELEELDG